MSFETMEQVLAKATPRPWRARLELYREQVRISAAAIPLVASLPLDPKDTECVESTIADGILLARAVNTFDQTLKALESAYEALNRDDVKALALDPGYRAEILAALGAMKRLPDEQ